LSDAHEQSIVSHLEKMDETTQAILKPFISVPSDAEWVRSVLFAYFGYFLNLGEDQESHVAVKKALQTTLGPLVPVAKRRGFDQMEAFLSDEFRRNGYYFLGGMTGPYYGPYVWARTEKRTFSVDLPDQKQDVKVFFMHDFLIRSWMHFQTFGRRGTGGWAKRNDPPWEDGLYSVASAYDMEHLDADLIFKISLLKHEAQHFVDKAEFPALNDSDLEYRAKLVELIYFSEMKYRLVHILHEANENRSDPHRYAAYCIVKELSARVLGESYMIDERRWASLPYDKIQAEAQTLLQEHKQRLNASPCNKKGVI
jgi:hypothetical protein